MNEHPYDGGYGDWSLAIHLKRLSHVVMQRDYWRNCLELYAYESGPLWRAI